MKLSMLVDITDGFPLFRHTEACRCDQFPPQRLVPDHRGGRAVSKKGVGQNEAQVIVPLQRRAANFDGHT